MSHKLEVDSVIKFLNNNLILSDIYFCCETSDIISIFGRNGSGKSTLFKIIFGTLNSENKSVMINNEKLNYFTFSKNNINYLPQNTFIPKYFSVKKSISYFLKETDYKVFCEDEIIKSIITKKISNLSFGELRYLEVKLVLCSKSKFSILDEPFQGLSPILINKIKDLIRDTRKYKGIIITDHNYIDVLEITNKIYLLKDGRIVKLQNPEELIKNGYLK